MRRRLFVLALAVAAPDSVLADDMSVPQVNWRYDEDWSVLRDARGSDDAWWEAAKYLPLDARGDVYLSTGLEARLRYEGFRDNLWGAADAPDDGYLWLRLMPHVDLHAGPVRLFAQGIAGYARGVRPEEGPADETGVDLLQGFADLRLPIGEDDSLTIRAGRELIAFGSERLVGIRYGPNIPQAFDGIRVIATIGPTRVDLVNVWPVEVGPADFDDRSSDSRRLRGIYTTTELALGERSGVDAYLLDYDNDSAEFEQGIDREGRHSFGVRFFGSKSGWSWNWEAMLQRGQFGEADIRAWSLATETGFSAVTMPLKPAFRLRANIASGDGDPDDGRLGTFNPMFPKGKYFGELSPIGPYNIINLHPSVDLDLGRGVSLGLASVFYWRESRNDGVYDVPGNLIRRGDASDARFIGTQGEGVLSWQASDILSFAVSLSAFFPGSFIRQSGPAETIRMIGFETMFRF